MKNLLKDYIGQHDFDFFDNCYQNTDQNKANLVFLPDEDVALHITLDKNGEDVTEAMQQYREDAEEFQSVLGKCLPQIKNLLEQGQQQIATTDLINKIVVDTSTVAKQCDRWCDPCFNTKDQKFVMPNVDINLQEDPFKSSMNYPNVQIDFKAPNIPDRTVDDSFLLLNDFELDFNLDGGKSKEFFNFL